MTESAAATNVRQQIVDALVGAAVLHAGVDPVLMPRMLAWVEKLQGVTRRSAAELATLCQEGAALTDDPMAVSEIVQQAIKEKWSVANTIVSRDGGTVVRVRSRGQGRLVTEMLRLRPTREIVLGAATRSSYYGLAVTIARDTRLADGSGEKIVAGGLIGALVKLARDGVSDISTIAEASIRASQEFSDAARTAGLSESLIGSIKNRMEVFSRIAIDAKELEDLGETLSFNTVEIPAVAFIEPEPEPMPEPRPNSAQGGESGPRPATGPESGETGSDPGNRAGEAPDDPLAEAKVKAFAQGFLSVPSDALIGIDTVLGVPGEQRDVALHLLERAKRARTWTAEDFAAFTNDIHLRGLPAPLRRRIIDAVKPEVGAARPGRITRAGSLPLVTPVTS